VRRLAVALLLAACGGTAVTGAGAAGGAGAGAKPPGFGGAGPWGAEGRRYRPAEGILEQPVVGATTDEAQNLWVATHDALYLLKPGDKAFRRFDARDGLHLQSNPVPYCDEDFGDHACPIAGAAADPGISEIEGGTAGEVFVGYFGIDDGSDDWTDPNRHSGKLDRVRLSSNGLQVDRFDLSSSNTAQFWHNRTVQRLVYDHFLHPHELYVGTNHGVDRLWPASATSIRCATPAWANRTCATRSRCRTDGWRWRERPAASSSGTRRRARTPRCTRARNCPTITSSASSWTRWSRRPRSTSRPGRAWPH
jgi:hypothetical protein